ncbi:DNA mismatch repair endonuclease MutL [Haliangium sp.]|uniref:DNA mismatch repair endonuclease MutL n=1 Tax=Haliangium sp. TaxID=2663208 RepID=UPI003D1432B9
MDDAHPHRHPIRVLPDEVIDQIAAGEVVERPASVVKELVENALDAHATHVSVEVEAGGKQLIRVLDNGVGMSEEEARLALTRHATSKLRQLDDLFMLDTMGFRGEALPSIAAVSRMTLTTRTRDQVAGTRLDIEGGKIVSVSEVGAPVGTQVEVRDLLFNVPARLKFLKGNATEASHITDAVSKLAMAHPHVHVRLRHGGRMSLDAPLHPSGLERARAVLGTRLGRALHGVSGSENGVRVEAYLAAPDLAQSSARGAHFFAGRRPVKERGLLHALSMGYGELVPKGRYPVAIVRVEVPDGDIDVNVHPQKLEVRFSDAQVVYAAVRHIVRRGLAEAPWLSEQQTGSPVRMRAMAHAAPPREGERGPQASRLAKGHAAETTRMLFPMGRESGPRGPGRDQDPGRPAPGSDDGGEGPERERSLARTLFPLAPRSSSSTADPAAQRPSGASRAADPGPWPYRPDGPRPAPVSPPSAEAAPVPPAADRDDAGPAVAPADPGPVRAPGIGAVPVSAGEAADFFTRLHYIGQLDCTYLVCEADGEMVLVDQHAAHERVEFQRLRERYQRHDIPVQRMLFPKTLELTPAQAAVVADGDHPLASMGFELEPFGGASYAVKAVPAGLRQGDIEAVLTELLDELAERGGSRALEERLDLALATIACHSVVRAGDRLSEQEVQALFRSMDGVDFKAHCPHGRPVLLRISVDEIARRFGR